MKKLLLILVLFVSGLVKSQIIDTNNFNYTLLEKMVLQKINDYRKTKKLSELVFSETLRVNASVKTSTANAKKDSVFHMPPLATNLVLYRNLYNELYKITNGKCGIENPEFVGFTQNGEIICKSTDSYETYEIMTNKIFNSWMNSPKHKSIIELPYDENKSVISCSSKKSKSGKIYTTVNFISLGYY
jgi:uncharacterized protein YkwD